MNVANLQLARAAQRGRELAIRAALGSGRSRLIRQLIAESLMLATAGAMLGAGIALGAVAWFRSVTPVELPPGSTVTVSPHVLLFTVTMGIAAGLLSGVMPSWRASRIDVNDVMKESSRGGTAPLQRCTRRERPSAKAATGRRQHDHLVAEPECHRHAGPAVLDVADRRQPGNR